MVLDDKNLGKIVLKKHMRARHITARVKGDVVHITYPPYVNQDAIKNAIEAMKPKLLLLKEKSQKSYILIKPGSDIKTFSFDLDIKETSRQNFYTTLKDGMLTIACPANTDYNLPEIQQKLGFFISKALRYEAKRILPSKVNFHAISHQFTYSEVKINKSKTHWGSCSGKKSINLSLYCLFLPEHLIDFIIKHELCHTVEMNHGERFWALLDSVTDNRAKALTKELSAFPINQQFNV